MLFVAEITDNEDAANQLTVEWTSSLDGTFSTTGLNLSNIAQLPNSLTRGPYYGHCNRFRRVVYGCSTKYQH